MALTVAREEEETKKEGSSEVVRWEKFLPRMVLRVLLVEADDSTRQIIAALLRKCSYRVAAVPDGLRAWETLKGRPHNIDIILTEVELPSISGYALLTLVMGHDICKNIPVIMMSSHDSISMVLKCMLKGAADFLIKPVRKNELKNLWQHVWRRQNLSSGNATQNSHKVEVTSGNNAASNQSSDCATSSHINKNCSEKGSDAHSSCTTPNGKGEAGDVYVRTLPSFPQPAKRNASNLRHTEREKCEEFANLDMLFTPDESSDILEPMSGRVKSSDPTALRPGNEQAYGKTNILDERPRAESLAGDSNVSNSYDNLIAEPCGRAIDLIGTFDNTPKYTHGSSTLYDGQRTSEFNPQLELSLRRSQPTVKRQGVEETHPLNHSNASAFSWYNGKALQPLFQTSTSTCNVLKEDINESPEVPAAEQSIKVNSVWQGHDATSSINQESMTTLAIGQSGKSELAYSNPESGLVRVPGVTLEKAGSGHGHAVPSLYYAKPRMPQTWSPNLANRREQSPFPSSIPIRSNCETYNSEQNNIESDETANNSSDQTMHQKNNIEAVEEPRQGSFAAGHSASSSLCNGVGNANQSSAYGSFCGSNDGNATSAVTAEKPQVPENSNDGGFLIHDRFRGVDSHFSSQREAALAKFRLKRKDRCYEKKVRYQSRKKLAEQRPRVKGQFVRQVQNDAPMADANV